MKRVLLVEPKYRIKYPNLALMKLSAKYKKLGYEVKYVVGEPLIFEKYDIVCISTMFTYHAEETIRCINYYKGILPEADIQVGGVFATLMPEYVEEKTGIKPFIGCSKELDAIIPDYAIVDEMLKYSPDIKKWEDFSIVFTTRGCPRGCAFCAVKKLEPKPMVIPNWRDHIDLSKKCVMIQDNNITAVDFNHFKEVMEFLIEHKLKACFNNGFDCRLLTEEQMQLMAQVKWFPGGLRVAFDNMSEDKHIQRTVKRLLELGVSKSAFLIFCLFNFRDDLDEAMYRHREMQKLGVRPYPQPYKPLDMLTKETYVSPKWTLDLIRKFRTYWLFAGNYKKLSFEEFLEKQKLK